MNEELRYQIALKKLDGIGGARARMLVAYCGGVREIFEASPKDLALIPGIGFGLGRKLNKAEALKAADDEIAYLEKSDIRPIFYLDPDYPKRLSHCEDAPILLYTKGNMELNTMKVVSIIGTRNATDTGRLNCERLVEALKPHQPLIVSGLALGIDGIAHRAALQHGLQTVGVMGNSLDRIYPHHHKSIASKMLEHGGLISEFEHGTKPDRENFPQRNRIVAGMCDVCIVIESGVKGGSMITAKQAAGYNRDVMAFPGRVEDPYSSGCNFLIKSQQAHMIESIDDLEYVMGWEVEEKPEPATQKKLFVELNDEERRIYSLLSEQQRESLDNLSLQAGFPVSKASTVLLELEFKGVVRSLPGKQYCLA